MAKTEKSPFSLEEKLREIRALLEQMQSGDLNFDENMRLFQQGTAAIQDCRNYLDSAELSIRQLIDTGSEPEEAGFE